MTTSVSVLIQYVKNLSAVAHVRPYQNKSPLSNAISGSVGLEKLPEEGHWRLEVAVEVTGKNAEEVLCFECGCAIEAIVKVEGLTEDEVATYLKSQIAGHLFANIRANLSIASSNTGYGPVTLPPITADRLVHILKG